jgi:hypothetical protein
MSAENWRQGELEGIAADMRILVLGGTAFVGRAITEDALRSGAELSLFNRGKTGVDLFPGVRHLTGDRETGDYAALQDGNWDAIIDVNGYVPRHVRQVMDVIEERIGRYVFISSHAVYRQEGLQSGATEDCPRREPLRDTAGSAAQPVQVIDCRDLARLVVQLVTDDRPGAFQAVGPADPVTRRNRKPRYWRDMAGADAELVLGAASS